MPASGKGTQAELLSKKLNLYYFQTGKLAREMSKSDEEIRKIVDSGGLVPEKVMTEAVFKSIDEKVKDRDNILFEGFPRFENQYQKLKDWLSEKGKNIDRFILLDINEEVAIERMKDRRICDKCGEVYNLVTNPPKNGLCKCGGKLVQRDDDKPDSIKKRFAVYKETTSKVADAAKKDGIFVRINGVGDINKINQEILDAILKSV